MFDVENNRQSSEGSEGIFSYQEIERVDPRKKGIWYMLRSTICPNLSIKSFITVVTIINIVIFTLQVFVDGIMIPGKFLEVKIGKIILEFGRDSNSLEKEYQFWRSITCLFLHGSFSHIFYNTMSMLIWGSLLEKLVGESFLKMTAFWILTGISGDFFSSWFQASNVVSVGASTAIYGIFGIFIGFLILNWHRFKKSKYSRFSVMIGIGFIILFNVSLTGSSKEAGIDNKAHIGGFISGIMVGLFLADLPKSETGNYEKKIKFLGLVLYLGFTSFCLLMIMIFKKS